ncbi:MAG: hypothetical protein QNI84_06160 [Henriciella sp.]|nr:hypothetical protein [Henriciella sp.]
MMLMIAALITAGYGVYYLWTGELPAHTLKVAASYGILTLLVFVVTVITKPAGEKH